MPDQQASVVKFPGAVTPGALDAEEVLAALKKLIPQVSSPVVQECLRTVRKEIKFLTACEGSLYEDFDDSADDQDDADDCLDEDHDASEVA